MMAAEAGFLPPVGVSCADMKFGMVTVSDGKTKPQPVSIGGGDLKRFEGK